MRGLFSRTRLPLVLGLTDGLLNALTLAAGSLIGGGGSISYGLAVRVAFVALVTAAFSVFVSDYAERRAQLVRASRELNLTSRGHLAATRLGRLALGRSLLAMAVACLASFVGSVVPLLAGALLPNLSWLVLVLAIGALAVLGAALGRTLSASAWRWCVLMGCGGIAVTWIGVWLHIT
ncbi:hypothetical protein K7472_31055 [Streptomyces sp. PTM05]|uniref:VIT family protein n=1 Tax=Streptantibioticus parmotrematis TaxID=2873249 RepID=A0ABS7R2Z0_9ACTN|nr:hypothetical protein [Streptantibioticus parmotrematis]